MKAIGIAACGIAACALVACAAPPLNAPLTAPLTELGADQYRYRNLAAHTDPRRNSEDVLVVVSLSGGGTRSAALAYGMLRALHHTSIRPFGRPPRSAADEIDILSGTSGGSFAALYYGAFRERMFAPVDGGRSLFERQVLTRNLERDLELKLVENFLLLQTSGTNRSDLAAEVYDDGIFAKKTYRDLLRQGRPYVIVNAHDTTKGSRFEFTQDQFDLICSDMTQFPLARAATASSAVHGIFAPIKLHSFPLAECPPEPPWVAAALRNGGQGPITLHNDPRDRLLRARLVRWYRTKEPYGRAALPNTNYYVHLGDGGAVDNLGLRGPLAGMLSMDSDWGIREAIERGRIKTIVLIVVNAAVPPARASVDRSRSGPTIFGMIQTAINASLGQVTQDSIRAAEAALEDLRERHGRRGLKVYGTVMVEFARLKDAERACFDTIGTRLALPESEVDALIDAGAKLLLEHPEFKRFVADTGGAAPPVPQVPSAHAWCKTAAD